MDTSAADKANAQNKKLQGEMGKVQADLENTKKELVQAKRDLERFEAAKRQLQQQGLWFKLFLDIIGNFNSNIGHFWANYPSSEKHRPLLDISVGSKFSEVGIF